MIIHQSFRRWQELEHQTCFLLRWHFSLSSSGTWTHASVSTVFTLEALREGSESLNSYFFSSRTLDWWEVFPKAKFSFYSLVHDFQWVSKTDGEANVEFQLFYSLVLTKLSKCPFPFSDVNRHSLLRNFCISLIFFSSSCFRNVICYMECQCAIFLFYFLFVCLCMVNYLQV